MAAAPPPLALAKPQGQRQEALGGLTPAPSEINYHASIEWDDCPCSSHLSVSQGSQHSCLQMPISLAAIHHCYGRKI